MAIEFTAWEADGKGQSKLSSIRSDTKNWFVKSSDWFMHWKNDPRCVLITKGRTDHQSPLEHILWQHPDYKDPVHEEN